MRLSLISRHIGSYLAGLLTAALYNLVAGMTGGIEFEGVQTNS